MPAQPPRISRSCLRRGVRRRHVYLKSAPLRAALLFALAGATAKGPVQAAPVSPHEGPLAYDREIVNQEINPVGWYVPGVMAGDGERVLVSGSTVSTFGKQAHGLTFRVGSRMDVVDSHIETSRTSSHGVEFASTDTHLNMRDSTVSVRGQFGVGIRYINSGNSATLTNSTVETFWDYANSVLMAADDCEMTMSRTTIRTAGAHATAIKITHNAQASLTRTLVETSGEQSVALEAGAGRVAVASSSIATLGRGATGVKASGNARIDVRDTRVHTKGDNASGVVVEGAAGAGVMLRDSDVRVDGADSWAAVVQDGGSIAMQGGSLESSRHGAISIRGANAAEMTIAGNARVVGGNGTFLSVDNTVAAPVTVSIKDGAYAQGNVERNIVDPMRIAGRLSMALDNGSHWVGSTRAIDVLSIAGDSTWTMTGDSRLGQLTLDNGGVVFNPSSDGTFKTLAVDGDMRGAGWFRMNTNLARGGADRIVVGGRIYGDYRILVENSGGEPRRGTGEGIRIIEALNGGEGVVVIANRGGSVDLGTFRYVLEVEHKDADPEADLARNWHLVPLLDSKPTPPGEGGKPPVKDEKETGEGGHDPHSESGGTTSVAPPVIKRPVPSGRAVLSTAANAAINTSAPGTAQSIWYAERDALQKRFGELHLPEEEGGVWVRGFSEQQRIGYHRAREFKQTVQGVALGADKRFIVNNGRWHVGAAFGAGESRRSFMEEGKGSTDSYHVGGYAAFMAENGTYFNALFKANRFRHDFNLIGTDGAAIKGKYANNGIGASLQAGKQIQFDHGWFVEPQAALSMVRVGHSRYTLSNGMRVSAGAGTSTQMRVGGTIGKTIALSNASTIQPYVQVGWTQELGGKGVVHTNTVKTKTDMSGGRLNLGVGVMASLGGNHSLTASYDYTASARIDQPKTFNLGYRYTW